MAKIRSQLERAQLENLSSDPSQGIRGRIWENTTSGRAKYDDGAVIREIVTSGGTASANNKLVLASDTLANLTALPRVAGTLYFATDTLLVYFDNGVSLTPTSGGGGEGVPSVVVSAAGNGDVTTMEAAFTTVSTASPSGGVVLVMDDVTQNTSITWPAKTTIMGRSKNAKVTLGASGAMIFGAHGGIEDIEIETASNITCVTVNGDYFVAENAIFTLPAAGTATGIDLQGNANHIQECLFTGVANPSTSDAINVGGGFVDNTSENNIFTS